MPASLDAPLPVPPPHVVQPPEPTPPSETSVKPEPVLLGDKSQFRYAAAKFDIYGVVGYMHSRIMVQLPWPPSISPLDYRETRKKATFIICIKTAVSLDPHDFRTCEVGDLSGKHGLLQPVESEGHSWLTGTKPITFLDPQLDWSNQPDVSIFYGRSINIHRPSDLTRYSCANLVETNQDWEPLGNFNGSSQVPTSTAQNLQSSATNSSAMMYHFTNSKWLMISLWSIMTTLVSSHYLFY
ncbi:hypothetical protein BDF22DRAFT_740740 [Syncephalis plumigaleata]|nr:hypothetical protein BDF22DRAFT_740740 [Syncephalis plumigaleata]